METDKADALQENAQPISPGDPGLEVPPASGLGRLITRAEMELHPGNAQFKRLPGV